MQKIRGKLRALVQKFAYPFGLVWHERTFDRRSHMLLVFALTTTVFACSEGLLRFAMAAVLAIGSMAIIAAWISLEGDRREKILDTELPLISASSENSKLKELEDQLELILKIPQLSADAFFCFLVFFVSTSMLLFSSSADLGALNLTDDFRTQVDQISIELHIEKWIEEIYWVAAAAWFIVSLSDIPVISEAIGWHVKPAVQVSGPYGLLVMALLQLVYIFFFFGAVINLLSRFQIRNKIALAALDDGYFLSTLVIGPKVIRRICRKLRNSGKNMSYLAIQGNTMALGLLAGLSHSGPVSYWRVFIAQRTLKKLLQEFYSEDGKKNEQFPVILALALMRRQKLAKFFSRIIKDTNYGRLARRAAIVGLERLGSSRATMDV